MNNPKQLGPHPTGGWISEDEALIFEFHKKLPEWLLDITPPCFIYDLEKFREEIKTILDTFPQYRYPLKCNPHPSLLATVLSLGAGVDVCSVGELEKALMEDAPGHLINYCSVSYTTALIDHLVSIEATVTLNNLDDLQLMLARHPAQTPSLRIEAIDPNTPYGDKFGFSMNQWSHVEKILNQYQTYLSGLHIHTSHSPDINQLTQRLSPLLVALERLKDWVPKMHFLNLGGGWPMLYGAQFHSVTAKDFEKILEKDFLPKAKKLGFKGEVLVEPGEYVTSSMGYWVAEVTGVKKNEINLPIVFANTPGVVPSAEIAYPTALFRKCKAGWERVQNELVTVKIVAATNSPFDTIRPTVMLPMPQAGDRLVFGQTGAYLPCLMGTFNSIPAPHTYIVHKNTSSPISHPRSYT